MLDSARQFLPRGNSLPEEYWAGRHRAVTRLLWAHAAFVPVYALVLGYSLWHTAAEGAIVPAIAAAAMLPGLPRRTRTAIASVGLLSASAILVHLSGGVIEMHFHFFVMVIVVALYQDWIPFLAAIGYVFVHHGLMGALDPTGVYNHAAAWNNPWKWAMVHAFFITGTSLACLVTWRLNEQILDHRRRVEDRLREETHIVETLHEVGRVLAAELDTQHVLQMVTDAATSLTKAQFGAFFHGSTDADGQPLMLYTLSGAPIESFAKFDLPRTTSPLFAATLTDRTIVRCGDVTKDHRYGHLAPHHGMPRGHLTVRSYLAVPVTSRQGDVVGGLFFGHPEPDRFTEVEERIVAGIASHASVALDNARLYESEHRARVASQQAEARIKLLSDASRALTSSLDIEPTLRELADLVAGSIARACAIDLVDDDEIRRVAQASAVTAHEAPGSRGPVDAIEADDAGCRARVLEAIRTGLTQIEEVGLASAAHGVDHHARDGCVVIPMVGRNGGLGAMTLTPPAHPARPLGADDLAVAEELARRAAVAVENAKLYARQRSVAETLQHSLLPERLPDIPGLEVKARYRPGGPGVDVGGDWYDVIQLPGGRLAIAMGDVAGRGERAAALMGQLRNAVRAYAVQGLEPVELVSALNRLFHELGQDNMATVFYAAFDLQTGVLRFVNAGHLPPIVIDPDGRTDLLEEVGGTPIGAMSHARYTDSVVTLRPGSTLLLYTDGLVETRTTHIDDGIAALRRSVGKPADDLDGLCDSVVSSLLDGRAVEDDVALLAVRMTRLLSRLSFALPAQPSVLSPLRATLRRWLSAHGATEAETYEVLVAACEACANAIQHATGLVRGQFDFEAVVDGTLHIIVRDRGSWRPASRRSGGQGLEIMRAFMDTVDVQTGPDGTVVSMRRTLATQSAQTVVN